MMGGNRNRFPAVMALCVALTAGALADPGQQDLPYVPSATTVALLPIENVSGITDVQEVATMSTIVAAELRHELAGRGFKVIEGKPIDDATARLKIDLTDIEQHKRAPILRVGKEVGADLVAFVVVTDVVSDTQGGFIVADTHATGKIKCWLLDVATQRSIMSAKVESALSQSPIISSVGGQVPRRARACAAAVHQAFDRVLKQYPFIDKTQ